MFRGFGVWGLGFRVLYLGILWYPLIYGLGPYNGESNGQENGK